MYIVTIKRGGKNPIDVKRTKLRARDREKERKRKREKKRGKHGKKMF